MRTLFWIAIVVLLSLAFALWVGTRPTLAQGGTWRCHVYGNGVSVFSGTYPSLAACNAACQSVAARLTIQTGRSHRAVCTRAGNGGLPAGKRRR